MIIDGDGDDDDNNCGLGMRGKRRDTQVVTRTNSRLPSCVSKEALSGSLYLVPSWKMWPGGSVREATARRTELDARGGAEGAFFAHVARVTLETAVRRPTATTRGYLARGGNDAVVGEGRQARVHQDAQLGPALFRLPAPRQQRSTRHT
jgi:hypothetical protein